MEQVVLFNIVQFHERIPLQMLFIYTGGIFFGKTHIIVIIFVPKLIISNNDFSELDLSGGSLCDK